MRAFAAVAVLVLVSACQAPPPAEMTDAERAQIEAEVLALAQGWMDIWDENDCEAASIFLNPESLSFLWSGQALNRSEWLEACIPIVANRESFSGNWTETKVHVLSPDAAVFVGTYTATYSYVDDTPARHYPRTSQMGLVERTATGWVFTTFTNVNGPYEAAGEG
jgi:hypothetical protein